MRTRSALLVASCVLAASVVTGGALNESVGAEVFQGFRHSDGQVHGLPFTEL